MDSGWVELLQRDGTMSYGSQMMSPFSRSDGYEGVRTYQWDQRKCSDCGTYEPEAMMRVED